MEGMLIINKGDIEDSLLLIVKPTATGEVGYQFKRVVARRIISLSMVIGKEYLWAIVS